MRDIVYWKPIKNMMTESHGQRTVYVRHLIVPFAGIMADADSAFTIPAFIRVNGKRVKGFITPKDGMAYMQEHGASVFVAFKQGE